VNFAVSERRIAKYRRLLSRNHRPVSGTHFGHTRFGWPADAPGYRFNGRLITAFLRGERRGDW
jgi:hypothetical protein